LLLIESLVYFCPAHRQARRRCKKPYDRRSCKISTFSLRNGLLQKRNNT